MPDKPNGPCCAEEPKGPTYPTVCLRDEALDKFLELMPSLKGRLPPNGDIITCEATFEVCGMSDNEYGRSLDLRLKSVGDVEIDDAVEPAEDATDSPEQAEPTDKPAPSVKSKSVNAKGNATSSGY